MRTGTNACSTDPVARISNQRVRILPRHALEGFARRRRRRAAVVFPRRVARVPLLQHARARGARVTEAVTLVAEGHVADAVYEEVRRHFTEKELADLTLAIAAINAWNRLSIAARLRPGTYTPAPAAV